MIGLSDTAVQAALAGYLATGGLLDGVYKLHLFANAGMDFSVNHVVGDFTPPAFTGYVAATVVATITTGGDGQKRLQVPPKTFTPSDGVNLPLTIYGGYLTDSNDDYFCGANFPAPIIISAGGQPFHVSAIFPIKREQVGEFEASIV